MRRILHVVLLLVVLECLALATPTQESQTNTAKPQFSLRPYLVSISVASLDESLKWYTENLGFIVLNKKDLPEYSLRIAFLQMNGFMMEMIEFKNSVSEEDIRKAFPKVDDRAKIQGFGKLAFQVEDIDAFAGLLKRKGVHFVREVQEDKELFHTKWFIVTDNSGNWIQFFQPTSS